MNTSLALFDEDKKDEYDCKGLLFKGHVSMYMSNRGVAQRKELRLLKRNSCPGCSDCCYVIDYISMELDDDRCHDLLDNIEHGKMYVPKFTWHKDWESGLYDDYDFEFVEMTNE